MTIVCPRRFPTPSAANRAIRSLAPPGPNPTTTAEQGYPSVQIGHWAGLYAPRGTPEPIIQRMNAELQAALKTPEVQDKLTKTGIEPAGGSVADFVAFMKTERQRLSDLAAKMKVTKEK